MKKLMFALACVASAAVMGADTLNNKADFEDFAVDTTATALAAKDDDNAETGSKFWQFGTTGSANDTSVVRAYGDSDGQKDNSGSQYLKLETNGDELQRKVNAESVGNGLYIDTLVQFTATPDSSSVSIDAGAKLAIWLEGEDTYTLKVKGGFMDATSNDEDGVLSVSPVAEAYSLTGSYSPDTWYRLTVQAISDLADLGDSVVPGFVIKINGTVVKTTSQVYTKTALEYLCPSQIEEGASTENDWLSANNLALLKDGSFIPSAVQQNFALTCVGFQGSGAIDNVTITDADPLVVTPTSVEFTITLGDNVSSVTYTVTGGEGGTLSETDTFPVKIGATVTVTAATAADWYTVTRPAAVTASESAKAIEVTATAVAVDENGALPAGTTAASLGITTGGFADADATALAPVVTWAKANNISVSAINAMEFGSNLSYNEKGYLFNMDPTDTDAIDDEEEGFKVTAISYNAETGKWEVEDNGKNTWNGKVEIRGAESLTNPTWSKDNEAGPFFKAFLTK